MKHSPFQSIYRENFEVVEQRQGNLTFYPHNDQLPILARALNFEFYGGLPPKLARVDHRADGFHKIALKTAALMFGGYINGGRADQLRLFYYLTPDLVAKITLVQQITEHTRRGLHHRFRWYGTHEFFPDIYLSGKQLIFSDHVLQRFRARVPECVSDDMSTFLMLFFGTPIISMSVGPSRAFILEYMDSILAFTYEETASEYIVTTCLTIHEINTLIVELPPVAHNLHYGPAFTPPRLRHWFPTKYMHKLHECWKRKVPFAPPLPKPPPALLLGGNGRLAQRQHAPARAWPRLPALLHGPHSRAAHRGNPAQRPRAHL